MGRRVALIGILLSLLTGVGSAQEGGGVAVVAADGAVGGGSALLAREYDLTRKMSPTPADLSTYTLRRGDLLGVTVLTGEPDDVSLQALVGEEGTINLPWVEPIPVLGLTLSEATVLVQDAYAEIYLRAYAQVQLQQLGTLQVVVAGYYDYPGLYRVYNGVTLYGLLLALNVDTDGRRRLLTLERMQEPVLPDLSNLDFSTMESVGDYDPFDFSIRGQFERDVFLEPWDRALFAEPETVISIEGPVARPGAYAVLPGESLTEVLELAGTIDPSADLYNTVLTRQQADGELGVSYIDLNAVLVGSARVELQDRDKLSLVPFPYQVYVLGQVEQPGAYPYRQGDGLLELLTKAGGVTLQAHAKFATIVRPPRLFEDRLGQNEVQIVDIRNYTQGWDEPTKYAIRAGDVIYIPSKGDRISGEGLLRSGLALLGVFVN